MSPGALAVLMLVIGVLAGALITTAAYAPELRRISRPSSAEYRGYSTRVGTAERPPTRA